MIRSTVLLTAVALAAGLVPGAAAAQSGWTYLQCQTRYYVGHPTATTRPANPTRLEESTVRIRTSPVGWQRLSAASTPRWDTDICTLTDFNTCSVAGDEVRLVGRRGYTNTINLRTLRQAYERQDASSHTWGEGTCRRVADPRAAG